MSDETLEKPKPAEPEPLPLQHIPWRLRRPGFWRCRRSLARLRKFQELVIHLDRWASHIDYARPLEKLIGKKKAKQNPLTAIETEMNKLALLVTRDMDLCGVSHIVTIDDFGKKRQRSLIFDYQIFPDNRHQQKFETLMQRLEMTIGQYEERRHQAILDWFNPLFWIACAVRVPVVIFENAGFVTTADDHSRFIKIYEWIVRVVFVFILVIGAAYAAKRLGLTLPWEFLSKLLG